MPFHLSARLSCGAILLICGAIPAAAAEPASTGAFDISAGAGVMMRPTYLGSDRYRASPLPLLSVKWNDMVSLDPSGLRLYQRLGGFTAGIGLTYDGGRDEKDPGGISFRGGDGRLKGMGKIGTAVGYQLFASYTLGRITFDANATKYDGSQNKGLLVRAGAELPIRLNEHFTIIPHGGASWANDRYMRTFFGVSSEQALHSNFARYDAESGFLGGTVGLRLHYRFDNHWFAVGDASTTFLAGDAKKSPISFSDTATIATLAIGYHF
ncbi:outer membrane scaffolding protein for murein synthesis (MipA/OmpV family) [Rhizomicrobium palustre]|uniref:Outer membrane scaffolding protein for murein synthesis (MipA/OmpV family) n=1 Tax=Rhizomicrobium palustre TaxID=189966 RepID=A0A846MWF1_9PROT|nr:MipA/OmpV family protein [Rhizomicrobium palustre]NIK87673.1 outer membrane scaffolding protein for murein synthesis (MipA/OmpV family) [Rhizomicrobium palustre]